MSKFINALAIAAIAGTATVASASLDYFSIEGMHDDTSYVPLDLVRSSRDGVVEIRDFRLGEVGELLGMTEVHAGANHNLKINIQTRPLGDVVAVLKSGGEVLAIREIDIAK